MSMITVESVSDYRTNMDQRNNRHQRQGPSSSNMNDQEDCDRILICPLSCTTCPSMSKISVRVEIPQSLYLSKESNIEMKSSYTKMKCNRMTKSSQMMKCSQTKKCNQSNKSYLSPSSLLASLITISSLINFVECKGGAARAGAGAGSVCIDCGSADTEEEVEASLIIVGIILIIFFVLCSCQFYQRMKWECDGNTGKKPMPQAPYNRDLSKFP